MIECEERYIKNKIREKYVFPWLIHQEVRNWFAFRYLNEYNRVLILPEVQAKIYQFNDLMSNLTKLTGKKMQTLFDLYFLYHTFVAESSLGLPLPEWAYDYFPYGPLFDAIVASYDISSSTPLLRRLFAGKLYTHTPIYTYIYIIKAK